MNCRYCGSQNITFYKQISEGKIQKQFHYGIICLDCKKKYKVERTKEVYEKVKDQEWLLKKPFKRKQQNLFDRLGNAESADVAGIENRHQPNSEDREPHSYINRHMEMSKRS